MSPTKVLQIVNVDGTVKAFLLPLFMRLEQEGYNIYVACCDTGEMKNLCERGIRIIPVNIGRQIRLLSNLRSTAQLYRIIKHHNFRLVHTHTTLAGVIGRIAALSARVPIVIHTMHGSFFFENSKLLYKVLFLFFEKILGRFTDFIFTLNNSDKLALTSRGIIVETKTQSLNGEGIDLTRFDPKKVEKKTIKEYRTQLGINNSSKVLGFVGRPIRKKGLFELFEAFKIINHKIKNIQLLIVGDLEPYEPDTDTLLKLKKIVHQNSLEKTIIFAGKRSKIPQLISLIDILILPSYGEGEGFGMALVEAAAMEKPTVATDIPCFRDAVLNNVTGLLVPPKDPKNLAKAILKLLSDDNLAKEMGRRGRVRAENLFDREIVLEKQVDIYKKLFEIRGLSN